MDMSYKSDAHWRSTSSIGKATVLRSTCMGEVALLRSVGKAAVFSSIGKARIRNKAPAISSIGESANSEQGDSAYIIMSLFTQY